jgi:hypothetical protein
MPKKVYRIYYLKRDGEYQSLDWQLDSVEKLQQRINEFELENGTQVIDVSYFPAYHPGISGGVRVAFDLKLIR